MSDLIIESINDEAVYRTAPATPGLLIIQSLGLGKTFFGARKKHILST